MIAARSSRNRRRLLVASVRDAVVERVGTPDVFLQHFRWAQLQCANAEGNEQTAELPAFDRVHDLLEHVATSDDLELFVLCLVHFGHYSLSRLFFNELDLELLSTLHGRLPLPLPIAPADQTDAAATLGRPETFEFRSLDAHRRLIRCKLDPRPVLDYLRAHFVLSAEQCARIEEADGREEQAERLVDHLRQTAAASQGRRRLLFARFCHALLISGQFDLLAFLDGDEVDWKCLDEYGAEQRERLLQHWRSLQENIQPVSTRSSNSATSFLKNRSDGEDDEQAGGEWGICVNMPDTNVACDLPYYRANKQNIYRNFSTPKGHVLLINNSHFSSRTELRDRTGTAEDVQALDKLLRQLGYSPAEIHHNLSGIEMLSAARRFARRPDHATVDSCVVIVLTHGEYDGLIGVDGHVINTHDFLACFNSRAAPNLSGKPKLFFIQACRGQNHDVGIPHQIPVDEWDARGSAADQQPSGSLSAFFSKMFGSTGGSPTRKPSKSRPSLPQGPPVNLSTVASVRFGSPALPAFDPNRFRLVLQPSEADFLIAYATVPRYVSWRNSVYGSWFVQAICEVFGKHAATDDLLTLLTKVNKRVCKFESSDVNRSKQIPEFSVRLQRTFYFFPGITSEE